MNSFCVSSASKTLTRGFGRTKRHTHLFSELNKFIHSIDFFFLIFLLFLNTYNSLCKEKDPRLFTLLPAGQVPFCLYCARIQKHPSTCLSSKKTKLTRVTRKLRQLYHVNGECLRCIKENQYHVLAKDETLLVMVKTVYLWYMIIIGYWVRTKLLRMLSGDQHAAKYVWKKETINHILNIIHAASFSNIKTLYYICYYRPTPSSSYIYFSLLRSKQPQP